MGKGYIVFWGRLDQNSGVHGNRKPPLTYNGENGVSTFSGLLLIQSFLYLQVTSTCIKSRMSSNFSLIGPLTTELAALERQKISHRLIMGKCCLHASLFIFDWNITKVAGNQDRHKSLVVFDFGPNQTNHFGGTCPWVTKISDIWTWISLNLWSQMASFDHILRVASLRWGKGWIKTLVSMATESPHWLIMGELMSPPFLDCFLSESFYTCR